MNDGGFIVKFLFKNYGGYNLLHFSLAIKLSFDLHFF